MGGNNEFIAPSPVSRKNDAGGSLVNGIRIHENKGEVHFHDDAANFKVAVPVAEMYKAWDGLRNGHIKKFKYTDYVNNSVLKMRVKEDKRSSDLQIRVSRLNKQVNNRSAEFESFDKLMRATNG